MFLFFPVSYDFPCNLTRYWLGDFDMVFITQFLKSNANVMYPQGHPPPPPKEKLWVSLCNIHHCKTNRLLLPLYVAVQLTHVLLCSDANKVRVTRFDRLKTKLYLSDLKTQFVPRSKQSMPPLYKPVS